MYVVRHIKRIVFQISEMLRFMLVYLIESYILRIVLKTNLWYRHHSLIKLTSKVYDT